MEDSGAAEPAAVDSYDEKQVNVKRKFSFLMDQEAQQERDEAAIAHAAANSYKAGYKDYWLFAYFCLNVMLIGNPLINSNAVLKMWKSMETFRWECSGGIEDLADWCPEQASCAKTALILYQAMVAGMALIGGVVVDTFSASMCLLIAHVMYGSGAHFLGGESTRGIFLGCVLQGLAGELLLNSVLPMCGLFGNLQYAMLLFLTFCNDLSVLIYPVLIKFFAPESVISAIQEEFYQQIFVFLTYSSFLAAIIGTFLLPVDDNGNLIPVTKASVLWNPNTVPRGVLRGSVATRLGARRASDDDDDWQDISDNDDDGENDESGLPTATTTDPPLSLSSPISPNLMEKHPGTAITVESPSESVGTGTVPEVNSYYDEDELVGDDDPSILLLAEKERQRQLNKDYQRMPFKERRKTPVLLWNLRFGDKLGTIHFWLIMITYAFTTIRVNFYLNNNQSLLEASGDNGFFTEQFMWILALGTLCGPYAWHFNDTHTQFVSLAGLAGLSLLMNICIAFDRVFGHVIAMVLLAITRSFLLPTVLSYTSSVFGLTHFPPLSVIIGLVGAWAALSNLMIDSYTEDYFGGDYAITNYIMIGLGVVCVAGAAAQKLFPVLTEDNSEAEDIPRELPHTVFSEE